MLKKIFYFGLGLSVVISEKFEELAKTGEARLAKFNEAKRERVVPPVAIESEDIVEPNLRLNEINKTDDLTTINGIGPTFAQRLKEAGVTTYTQLAALTCDQLKEITRAADWQADPNDWIQQAQAAV